MGRRAYTEDLIVRILKEVEGGATITETCRKHGIAETTFFRWREKYTGMGASELGRLRELEKENERLRNALADSALTNQIQKEALAMLGKR